MVRDAQILVVTFICLAITVQSIPIPEADHELEAQNVVCPTSKGQVACPSGWSCCFNQYSPANQTGCAPPGSTSCCTVGPPLPASTTLPNCLIIGDSVSIGYTRSVVQALSSVCQVQHGPWDVSNGGAGTTANGLQCLPLYLNTAMQVPIKWDLIQFNFGLHDLDNSTTAEATYAKELGEITEKLVATGSKLQYALTTPFRPLASIGDHVVDELNVIAEHIMGNHSIPAVDLNTRVHDYCGKNYTDCSICRMHPCSYHYTTQGYDWIASPVVDAIKARLH